MAAYSLADVQEDGELEGAVQPFLRTSGKRVVSTIPQCPNCRIDVEKFRMPSSECTTFACDVCSKPCKAGDKVWKCPSCDYIVCCIRLEVDSIAAAHDVFASKDRQLWNAMMVSELTDVVGDVTNTINIIYDTKMCDLANIALVICGTSVLAFFVSTLGKSWIQRKQSQTYEDDERVRATVENECWSDVSPEVMKERFLVDHGDEPKFARLLLASKVLEVLCPVLEDVPSAGFNLHLMIKMSKWSGTQLTAFILSVLNLVFKARSILEAAIAIVSIKDDAIIDATSVMKLVGKGDVEALAVMLATLEDRSLELDVLGILGKVMLVHGDDIIEQYKLPILVQQLVRVSHTNQTKLCNGMNDEAAAGAAMIFAACLDPEQAKPYIDALENPTGPGTSPEMVGVFLEEYRKELKEGFVRKQLEEGNKHDEEE